MKPIVETKKWITRDYIRDNKHKLFVFGDNISRRGYGGQAKEMRGEPNSFGIPTKHFPNMSEDSFFHDRDKEIEIVVFSIMYLLQTYNQEDYSSIVWPTDGIGTGLAMLEHKSPHIYQIIKTFEKWLLNE